jgi:hypothetical protein
MSYVVVDYLRNVGLEPDERFLQEGLQRLAQTVIGLEAAEHVAPADTSARQSAGPTATATGSGCRRHG